MSSVKNKFMIYAAVSLFIMLTVLLSVINVINFTMAANDADRITKTIASHKGLLLENVEPVPDEGPADRRGGFDGMGPDSPDMNPSVRYFTFRFKEDGTVERISFNLSALSEDEAKELAQSLLGKKRGWTNVIYRYRVYSRNGSKYVTVIDQSRELLPSYRILIISVIGEIVCMIISVVLLLIIGKYLFKPLEDADRKQKKFIKEAESDFKVPLTVIEANAELIEKENGANDYTKAIRRQVKKMTELTKQLRALAIVEESELDKSSCDLSDILSSSVDRRKAEFETRGVKLETSIEQGVRITADDTTVNKTISELIENALKFAKSKAKITLANENGSVKLTFENDTELQDSDLEQIFDRFTRLSNAEGKPGNGLGLSYVKDAVKANNGRMNAKVRDGVFTLTISL
ncbi:MAG: HAMP domain-containing histidine kinase [Clostridia bacterium]|nr:HAMP domain-containing histidine kinase [Clostridia bacterium]